MPLKTSDGIGTWIKDFKKSKAPQFKGKSKEKRRQQAIAAYLSAKDGGRNEEKMKTFKEVREGYASAAQRKAVWAARNDEKEKKEDATDQAVKDFLSKGGKIKKLKPAKAQGYHGKDDPGQDVKGIMSKDDSKAIGTRKKVKSMESVMHDVDHTDPDFKSLLKKHGVKHTVKSKGPNKGYDTIKLHGSPDAISKVKKTMQREDDDTARMYKDNPEMMKKGGPGGYKSLNKAGKKAVKNAMNTELTHNTMNKYYDKAKKSLHRAKNSHDANIMRKTDPSKDKATIDKRVKGIKLAKTRTMKKIRGDK